VGKWETCFWFSTFPSALVVGAVGMWNLACLWRDFQGARGKRGKPVFGFPRFPQPRHFHGAPFSPSLPAAGQQCQLGFLHPPCRLGIAPGCRLSLQHSGGDSFLQVRVPLRQRPQFLVRCSIVLVPIPSFAFPVRVGRHRRVSTGPVEVQLGVHVGHVELLPLFGMLAGNGAVANLFAHDRPVLAFHQRVVGASVSS
jgi:hypothetical protein